MARVRRAHGLVEHGYAHRARIETTAPAGYTVHFDASAAIATSLDPARRDVRIVSCRPG